ncbi:unnamed protein product [Lactuca virosa]|uniref:AT-hook motif nuclear-localized protein n=1 Tax=Lactuca virosa TaxID=75947 RepID=A0AAU9LZ65_9ASTR|nr:unnamed protein product [Lactuca virosa]
MSIKVLSTAVVGAVEESKVFITFSLTSGLKYHVSQHSATAPVVQMFLPVDAHLIEDICQIIMIVGLTGTLTGDIGQFSELQILPSGLLSTTFGPVVATIRPPNIFMVYKI